MKPAGSRGRTPEIEALRKQIIRNCHRSDAGFAGYFSLCGLMLRLRDYYKWSRGLSPWQDVDNPEILAWIEKTERMWEETEGETLDRLHWKNNSYDPFEAHIINNDLRPNDLYYGSGLAAFMKPSFFLAEIDREERLGEFRVLYLGTELARDLFTVPAQTRSGEILIRRRPLAAYIWDTIHHTGHFRQQAMDLTLECHGLRRSELVGGAPETWEDRFQAMLDREMEPYVRHEYGEATDETIPDEDWRNMIAGHPHSRVELLARSIKDVLADTCPAGRLDYIISRRQTASAGLFISQLDGLPARLFFDFIPGFKAFLIERDWPALEEVRLRMRQKAVKLAGELLGLYRQVGRQSEDWFPREVNRIFFRPIGLDEEPASSAA